MAEKKILLKLNVNLPNQCKFLHNTLPHAFYLPSITELAVNILLISIGKSVYNLLSSCFHLFFQTSFLKIG